jgi:hypothetical protein
MAKSNIYPLVAPAYPNFIPATPATKRASKWLPWGRTPRTGAEGIISIGLPRATSVATQSKPPADRPVEIWQPPASDNNGGYGRRDRRIFSKGKQTI